ncbi:MAG: 6-phosphogluconolactonase [Chloroflexi bacterium]|nr:6-phosphogluconolactonase [Chloroflexota bacterium]
MTQGPDGTPRILVASGPDAIARTAADLVVAALAGAIGDRGVAHLALTGGSSARGLYRELRGAGRLRALDWGRVHLWTGDDRVVPLDHEDSNMGLALRELLGPGGPEVPEAHVHPMLAGVDVTAPDAPGWAAGRYAADLSLHAPAADDAGTPLFDLLLLGMGPDGHILSVFPDSPALEDGAPGVMGIPAPTHIGPSVARVTLGPGVVGAAREILLMVGGAAKAPVVVEVLEGDPAVSRYPARLARIDTATWLLDPESAADLTAG